jgi:rhodanese-related sulfurtransferase
MKPLITAWLLMLVAAVARAGAPEVRPVSQDELLDRQKSATQAPYVLDVRTPEEYVAGHVPGAVNIPYDRLASRIAEVPRDRDVVLYCRTGRRAGIAAEVLAAGGYTRLEHLTGDIVAWTAQGLPLETPKDPAACVAALGAGRKGGPACAPL